MIEEVGLIDGHLDKDAICCTTNMQVKNDGRLVMGAGIAKYFNDKFYGLAEEWGLRIKEKKHSNGFMVTEVFTLIDTHSTIYAISFPTKVHWKDKSSLELILESTKTLVTVTDCMGWNEVVLPRPGCSNGGLDWETEVKPLIEPLLDDRFTIISLEK